MVTMGKNKMTKDKASIRKWIPLVSIALISFFVFFAGCLDNEPENEVHAVEPTSSAAINMSQEIFGTSEIIEFEIRNTGSTDLMFGRNFNIELYNESSSQWEAVEMDMVVTMDMIILAPGEVFTQGFNPEEVFVNEVKEGQYRIKKSVSVADTDESMELEKAFRIEAGNE